MFELIFDGSAFAFELIDRDPEVRGDLSIQPDGKLAWRDRHKGSDLQMRQERVSRIDHRELAYKFAAVVQVDSDLFIDFTRRRRLQICIACICAPARQGQMA